MHGPPEEGGLGHQQSPCVHTREVPLAELLQLLPLLCDRAGHPLWPWGLQLIKGRTNRDLELVSRQGFRFYAENTRKNFFQITMNQS